LGKGAIGVKNTYRVGLPAAVAIPGQLEGIDTIVEATIATHNLPIYNQLRSRFKATAIDNDGRQFARMGG